MRAIKHKKTFEEVLNSRDDQLAVKIILTNLVPDKIKDQIVVRYNELVTSHNNKVADMQRPMN